MESRIFSRVGPRAHLKQISLSGTNKAELKVVIDAAMTFPRLNNELSVVTKNTLFAAT